MSQARSLWVVCCIMYLAICVSSWGETTLYVPSSGYSSIQDAIDAATNGDIVVVFQGTYYENLLIEDKTITLTSTDPENSLVVAATIIDGNGFGSVIRIKGTSSTNTVIRGLTIQDGNAFWDDQETESVFEPTSWHENNPMNCGGGICVEFSNNWVSVYNCIIKNNRASVAGGGIYNVDGFIQDCTIEYNEAWYIRETGTTKTSSPGIGGGLAYCNYLNERTAANEISNCIIRYNTAFNGGGLYLCDMLRNCEIRGNSALSYAEEDEVGSYWNGNVAYGNGASYCSDIEDCYIIFNRVQLVTKGDNRGYGGGLYNCNDIRNCKINSNSTLFSGGGVHGGILTGCTLSSNDTNPDLLRIMSYEEREEYGGGATNATLINCRINNNWSIFGGGLYQCDAYNCEIFYNHAKYGGGLYSLWGKTLKNCIIDYNGAHYGGAIYGHGDSLYNCTIANNRSIEGGPVYIMNPINNSLGMKNCIIWDNTPTDTINVIEIEEAPAIQYSCFSPGSNGDFAGKYGNITLHPQFITDLDNNLSLLGFPVPKNFHLAYNSPCIDAGDPLSSSDPSSPNYISETDFDGEDRIVDFPITDPAEARIDMGMDEVVDVVIPKPIMEPITISNPGISGNNPRTCMAWVKTESQNSQIIMSWGESLAGKKWELYLSSDGKFGVDVEGGYIESSADGLNDGNLHHVAAVLPPSSSTVENILLYIDGVEVTAAASSSQQINTTSTEIIIGQNFDGLLEDVRIYKRALSANAIRDVINQYIKLKYNAFWKFDQDVTDSLGRYDGEWNDNNNSGDNYVTSMNNYALQYDGVDDYIEIPDFDGIGGSIPRTCAAWIKTNSSSYQMIMSWGASESKKAWMVGLNDSGQLQVGVFGGTVTGSSVLNDGKWHHVAVVLVDQDVNSDGRIWIDEIDFYVDGLPESITRWTNPSLTDPEIDTSTDMNVTLGVRNYNGMIYNGNPMYYEYHFNGLLDEVLICSQAYDFWQIHYLVYDEKTQPEPDAYWALDETSGDEAVDSSGNGYDGNLTGSTWNPSEGFGGALELDGDDYIEIDDTYCSEFNGIGGSDPRTCSAWIKTSTSTPQMIMSWGASESKKAWMISVTNAKLSVGVFGGTAIGDTDINDGQWHHVAVVLHEDLNQDSRIWVEDIQLYVDGKRESETYTTNSSLTDPVINTSTDMNMTLGVRNYNGFVYGNETWYYMHYFNGLLDDVRIYDQALLGYEIAGLYLIID